MAVYRNIQISFWTDNKVEDNFTPEDKYFYLYLLTNPQTNICGCYEVSYKQMCSQTGYNEDTINRLLDRFENEHKMIKYSKDTKEILILNWHKYNWSSSKTTIKGVLKVAQYIKCKSFKDYVVSVASGNTVEMPIELEKTAISVNNELTEIVKRIVDYMNNKCNTSYRHTSQKTRKHISARINEGFSENDFFTVIDNKSKEWLGTEYEKYLRPETLFGTKFEGYLNQKSSKEEKKTRSVTIDGVSYEFEPSVTWLQMERDCPTDCIVTSDDKNGSNPYYKMKGDKN